ncbi:MAG TPA: hypothetical protein VKV05_02110, partial [Terriglobales bacterium]|nr:hypothetical protein [Terriglobales bacterium]
KAVKAAQEQHGVQFEGNTFFVPNWQLIGRILREAEWEQAQKAANDITRGLNQVAAGGAGQEFRSSAAGSAGAAGHFQPAVVWTNGHIICGARPAPEVEFAE